MTEHSALGASLIDSTKIEISKIEAARRQLDCAIDLWFHDSDEISIHTLVGAAHQIIHDITKHKGLGPVSLFDAPFVKEEARGLWISILKKPINFFKHADRDPDPEGSITLVTGSNLLFMLSSLIGLELLEISSWRAQALKWWLTFNDTGFIDQNFIETLKKRVPVETLENVQSIKKNEFLKVFYEAARRAGHVA